MSEASALVVGWLATYAIHSTLLIVATAAVTSRLLRSDAWRDVLWKTALFGSLATTSIQMATGATPLSGRWALDVAASSPRAGGSGEGAASQRRTSTIGSRGIATAWADVVVAGWATIAAVLLLRLVAHHVVLRRHLTPRRRVTEEKLDRVLAVLRRDARLDTPVRLTVSARCATPIALGRREICVPARFVTDLDVERQRGALAHELAHLQRGDPTWQLAMGVLEAVLFFQPLNRMARRRLHAAAENLCDDWAVRLTGSPLDLARCLTEVASWLVPVRVPAGVVAIGRGGSSLVSRVTRLAEWEEPAESSRAARVAVAAGVLLAALVVAPAVGSISESTPGAAGAFAPDAPVPPAPPPPPPPPEPAPLR